MKRAEYELLTAIDQMRMAVKALNYCNETFLQGFTVRHLLSLHRAWALSPWDFYPDTWSHGQVAEALMGIVPNWDEDEEPCQGIPLEELP